MSDSPPPTGGQLLHRPGGPKGQYLLRVYVGRDASGRRKNASETFYGRRPAAYRRLAELVIEVTEKRRGPNDNSTMSQLVERWLNIKKPDVAVKTLRGYRDCLANYVKPTLGERRARDIGTYDLDSLLSAMQTGDLPEPTEAGKGWRGQPLSPRTVRLTREVLRQLFEKAVYWGIVRQSPVNGTSAPRQRAVRPQEALRHAERAALLDVAAGHHYYVYLRLMVDFGLRPGEAAGLRWSDVDLARGIMTVRVTVGEGVDGPRSLKAPKTGSSARDLPLTPEMVSILRQHRLGQKELGFHHLGHVVTNTRGELLAPNHFDGKLLTRFAAAAGIKRRVTQYTLRHTFCTLLSESGVPLKVVSKLMGHTDVRTTANVYQHVDEDQLTDVIADYGRWLLGAPIQDPNPPHQAHN